MATEQYSIGYEEGFQNGWNAAVDSLPAQRKPLTNDEIWDAYIRSPVCVSNSSLANLYAIARAIEAAHNIKENT